MKRVVLAILAACVVPSFAVVAGAESAGGADAGSSSSRARIPPDPAPMVSRQQWVFDLRWDKGDAFLVGIHALDLGSPQPTPRVMGRFALELFEGPVLIERVRFDFPMLAPPEEDGALAPLTKGLRTRIGVVFPATHRGTRLELWDRATDKRWSLPWPPQDLPAQSDAGHDGG